MRRIAAIVLAFITISAAGATGAVIVESRIFPPLSQLVVANDGQLWALNRETGNAQRFETGTGTRLPRTSTWLAAPGPAGDFWFIGLTATSPLSPLWHTSSTGVLVRDPQYSVASIARGGDVIWFAGGLQGGGAGKYLFQIDAFGMIRTFPTGFVNIPSGVAPAADGGAWIALSNGDRVYHITRDGVITSKQMPLTVFLGTFSATLADGTFWLSGLRNAVRFDAAGNAIDSAEFVNQTETFPLADDDGALWLGESGGLVRVKNGALQWFDPGVPPACGVVPQILNPLAFDSNGYLWATTRGGISYGLPGGVICDMPAAIAYRIDTSKLPVRKRAVRH